MSKGFSLVELSIVLVILGLLTGGILAGQSLIRASELRAVSSEYQRYTTAAQTFRDKYFALPGDINNATSFWGRYNSNADCVSSSGMAVSSPGACDGDASGLIIRSNGNGQAGEHFGHWRHLALAGLIEGQYSGVSGGGGYWQAILGTNIPRSRLGSTVGWNVHSSTSLGGSTVLYALPYGNYYFIGGVHPSADANMPVLKPEEAWNIDSKMDDGKPASGKVVAMYWNNACSAPDDGTNFVQTNLVASYRLTDSSTQCVLVFRNAI